MQSDRQLKHWYDKFNRDYWSGELPSHTVLTWEPPPQACADTCPVYHVDHGQFAIRLDPILKIKHWVWQITLLHEMTHIAIWEKHPRHQHGKVFKDEIDRLYAMGAFRKLI